MQKIVIAIDGYSACGKSSTAKGVASALRYAYIDTGAMYRAVTLYFLENKVALTDDISIRQALDNIAVSFSVNPITGMNEAYLNGRNVEDEIRGMVISDNVSQVSSLRSVRVAMVAAQKKLGNQKGVVMDGRDIGTVVFPSAELKVFMTADIAVRGKRRQKELHNKGQQVSFEAIVKNLESRDRHDTTREESPLRQAVDAYELDTTFLTLEEQIDIVTDMALAEIIPDRNS